jgi:hypothetical protein
MSAARKCTRGKIGLLNANRLGRPRGHDRGVLTTVGGALSVAILVCSSGLVIRRVQERHWLRDGQLNPYEKLSAQYARFMTILRRARRRDTGRCGLGRVDRRAHHRRPHRAGRAGQSLGGFGRAIQLYPTTGIRCDPIERVRR